MPVIFKIENNFCEYPFLKEVVKYLGESFLNKYDFYICGLDYLDSPPAVGDNVIVLLLSDEFSRVPPYINDVKCVFKTGVVYEDTLQGVIPFPLGYTKLFKNTSNVILKNKDIDVFFSGQAITQDRHEMIYYLNEYKINNPQYNCSINVSDNFLGGMDSEEYTTMMYRSKICFCPAGTTMAESFRFFEAFAAGCVVYTKEYIPETKIYKDAPIIKMNHWNQSEKAINHLLGLDNLLERYYNKTCSYYESNYSEKAVARYITNNI